jgi:hypothetical protein
MQGFRLFLGTLTVLLAATPAFAQAQAQKQAPQNQCPFVKTVQINVIPVTEEVKIDGTKTLAEMQNTEIDTINPYAFSGVTQVHGFMNGLVGIVPDIRIGHKYVPEIGAFCLWYEKIDVKLQIKPEIVIGKEIYQNPCLRKATLEHEMKHVNVDRQIVNKYAKIIGKKIYAAIEERGFRAQPVAQEYVQGMADRMGKVLQQTLEHEHEKLQIERMELQRAVDSLEEYERTSALCPEERAKLPGWASSVQKK